MANVKISQLPAVTSLSNSDILPSVAGSTTSKISLLNLANSLPQVSSSISASAIATLNQKVKVSGSLENGSDNTAAGAFSHAEGLATIAAGAYQHVQGQYNIASSSPSAFIMGNGESGAYRSNLIFASGSDFVLSGSLLANRAVLGYQNQNAKAVRPYSSYVSSISYVNIDTSSLGLRMSASSVDDSYYQIDLPFTMSFLGTSYNTVYVGSNSYLTFGGGSSTYNNLGPTNPALPGIQVYVENPANQDTGLQRIYTGSLDGNQTFVVYFVGDSSNGLPATENVKYAYVFYSASADNNKIDLHVNNIGSVAPSASIVTDGVSSKPLATIGTYQGSSYAFRVLTNTDPYYFDYKGTLTNGIGNAASAEYAHAEGGFTIASASGSHSEGFYTTASGVYSHAEGLATIAAGAYQHVQGQYNVTSSANSAFIIGNGTSDGNRRNLVLASGSEFHVSGSLNVSGAVVATPAANTGANTFFAYDGNVIVRDYTNSNNAYFSAENGSSVVYVRSGFNSGLGPFIAFSNGVGTGRIVTGSNFVSNYTYRLPAMTGEVMLNPYTGSVGITGSLDVRGAVTQNGFVILTQVSESLNFPDDAAAAAGGVPLGGLYRNGNVIAIRTGSA